MTVSVVIPTYNRADLVVKAIESVLQQTYQNIEIIVVSDGSTDNTDQILRSMEANDKRITYISYYPSVNGNHARNIGIEAAKGEYIAFIDDDDIWVRDKLQKQLDVFESDEKIGLVYTGANIIYVKERITYQSFSLVDGDLSQIILSKNCIGTTSTVMIKAQLFKNSGVFDDKLPAMQDYDLWIRICQLTKIGCVKEPCIDYYNRPSTNQISQQVDKYIIALTYISEKYDLLFASMSTKARTTQRSNYCLVIANYGIRNNHRNIALKYVLKALKLKLSIKAFVYFFLAIMGNYSITLRMRKKFRLK